MNQGTVAEIKELVGADGMAKSIGQLWDSWNSARREWLDEKQETRNFLFATDTRKTSVGNNTPWKNSTTVPKLTQIRDNLHANYLSALFPNDDWMRWEAYSLDPEDQEKRTAIQAYMSNKTRESNMRTEVSKLLYDYIDYGNAF